MPGRENDTLSGKLRAAIVSGINDKLEKCIMKISILKA